jgi:hypothetical protein
MAKNTVVISLVAENERLNAALSQSERKLKAFQRQMENSKKGGDGVFSKLRSSAAGSIGPLAGVGAAFASVGGAAAYLEDSVKTTENLALATKKISRETGMDLKTSSEWLSLAKERGIDTNKLSLSFGTLSKQMHNAEGGSKSAAKALASVGVSGALISSGNLNGALGKIADRFKAMKDGPDKTALALQLFGRQGKALIPILNQGSSGVSKLRQEMDKAHLSMGPRQIADADRARKAQKELHKTLEGLKVTVGSALMPAFASAAGALSHFVDQAMQGKGAGGLLKTVVVQAWKAAEGLWKTIGPVVKTIGDWVSKNPELVKTGVTIVAIAVAGAKLGKAISTLNTILAVSEGVFAALEVEMLPFIAVGIAIVGIAYLIITNWKPISKFFSSVFKTIVDAVRTYFNIWRTIIVTVMNVIKTVIVTVWNGIRGFFIGAWNAIKNLFSSAATFILSAAKHGFLGPIPFILSHWKTVLAFFKSLPGQIVNFISSIPGRLGSLISRFAQVGSDIGSSFINALGNAIQSAGSFLADLGNGIRNWINDHTIFGDDVHIGTPLGSINFHIPALATGGMFNGAQIAMIGEDGPEAVIPLSKKHRARGAALYAQAGSAMGLTGGHTFVVNNYGGELDETQLAASFAWQLQTRSAF